MRIKSKRSKPRRGPLRDPAYRAWLREQRCAVWRHTPRFRFVLCGGSIDAAHTVNNGMASKGSDASCLPLCRTHHQQFDAGREYFNIYWGINCAELAKEYWEIYQREARS